MGHKAKAVTHARCARNFQCWVFGQQCSGLGVDAVDDVHGAGLQCGGALVRVANVDQLDTVKIAAVGLPVVAGLALEGSAHTRLEFVQHEGASAVGFAEVFEAIGTTMMW